MGKTYAIGDIHGCLTKLRELVSRCKQESEGERPKLIFVGDYIDRGPESRGVVEFLIDAQNRDSDAVICLVGNHEALVSLSAHDVTKAAAWLHNGGSATLLSYGAKAVGEIPRSHISWFQSLPLHHEDGLRFF